MNILIYSRPNCGPCNTLKADYRRKNIPFTEIVIGIDISLEQFKENYPNVKTVPFVVTE